MTTTIIAAVAGDRAIGRNGDLIWHLREDLKHFKALTLGHAVVMGRRTWLSLPTGALPGRLNVVVSGNPDFKAEGAEVVQSVEEALRLCRERGEEEIFIIGGATLYQAALDFADAMELTEVEGEWPDADTFFPEWDKTQWRETKCSDVACDPRCGINYQFKRYERR